jgi:hypothetical protein
MRLNFRGLSPRRRAERAMQTVAPVRWQYSMAWRGEPAFPGRSARQVHDFCKVQSRTNRSVRSYVIQGMRMLAVTWANDMRGKSVSWLHTAVRRGIWPSVDDQLGITPRA